MSGSNRDRVCLLAAVCALALALGSVGFLDAPAGPQLTVDRERPTHTTLVGLQGYHEEGRAIELSPAGEVLWRYEKFDDVFDVEALGEERVQIAGASTVPDTECPSRFRDDGTPGCVRNAVRIVDRENKATEWEYAWYDVERHEHELHDVDRYRVNGEARWVFVDMGNDRVFAVDRAGEIQWRWSANETYDRPPEMGPEGDWTHINDIDRLGPGVFQVSLRNFDTVVELRVEPNGSVGVTPIVGPNDYDATAAERGPLYEQHNPDRLAEGHLLVADSKGDRVVELDRSGEVVWTVGGSGRLDWPRDADRLGNGHTLITDSYNDRIVEVDGSGAVVWAVETGGLPYDADRLNASRAGEGSSDRPTAEGAALRSQESEASSVVDIAEYGLTLLKYTIPGWLSPYLLALGALAGVGALFEVYQTR